MSSSRAQLSALIVDDIQASRVLIESFLKLEPLQLVSAENGQEAIDLYKRSPCDIILMDLIMPETDGFEATKQIRAWELTNNLPRSCIFALTGNDQPGDIQYCLDVGCDGHIMKPVTRIALLNAIHSHPHFNK